MSDFRTVALCATEAAALIDRELGLAREAAAGDELERALDGYTRALGLALQLGPATCEQVLRALLEDGPGLRTRYGTDALARLGPALVEVVRRVEEEDALPETPVMEAWATVAADFGAIIGQVGLALSMPAEGQGSLMDSARRRAEMIDEATDGLFDLKGWVSELG